ncbi:MAG: polymerase subunit sigma-24 [Gammaproteobacteria bacterium]|nr:polymerase subunit sigma-24 [Gammaproteobacteria bacterium]
MAVAPRVLRFCHAAVLGLPALIELKRVQPLVNKVSATRLRSELGPRFSGPLMSFFLRRVKDRSQAEDLTQEVLLRVIRASDWDLIENAEGYVFKAAANLLNDHRRRVLRNPTLSPQPLEEALEEEFHSQLVEDRSPERVLLGEATLAEALQALEELGELTRNVFILFRLENMKQKDIAALYGIGHSTVEKHVMKAVLHLATRCGRK